MKVKVLCVWSINISGYSRAQLELLLEWRYWYPLCHFYKISMQTIFDTHLKVVTVSSFCCTNSGELQFPGLGVLLSTSSARYCFYQELIRFKKITLHTSWARVVYPPLELILFDVVLLQLFVCTLEVCGNRVSSFPSCVGSVVEIFSYFWIRPVYT